MLTKQLNSAILIAVIITVLLGSIIYFSQNDSEIHSIIVYEFRLVVDGNGTSTFMLPVPLFEGQLVNFNYSTVGLINSTADLAIVNTTYGPALQIVANGTNEIQFRSEISMRYNDYMDSKLSMYESALPNNVEYYSWIFYNGTSSANITLKYHGEGAGYGHIIGSSNILDPPHEFSEGWNTVIVDNRFPEVNN